MSDTVVWISGATEGIGLGLARTVPYAGARVVKRELKSRGRNAWVVAVRPGFVDTPTTRFAAQQNSTDYPVAPQIARQLQSREGVMTPEEAGRDIWRALPPANNESLLLFGEMVPDNRRELA
jgi:benzil reductase ((S)-benzoin forming)